MKKGDEIFYKMVNDRKNAHHNCNREKERKVMAAKALLKTKKNSRKGTTKKSST
jgi:hypothetical protein